MTATDRNIFDYVDALHPTTAKIAQHFELPENYIKGRLSKLAKQQKIICQNLHWRPFRPSDAAPAPEPEPVVDQAAPSDDEAVDEPPVSYSPDILLAGDDWADPELRQHALGFIFRDEVMFQEAFFPDFSPSRDDTELADYRRWEPDNYRHVVRSQIPLFKWRVLHCAGGRGTDKTGGAQVRDTARSAVVHRRTRHGTVMMLERNLDPQHFDPTVALFTQHPLLALFFKRSDAKDKTVFLTNGSAIMFQFPGLQGGRRKAGGVQGFRTHDLKFDEAQHLVETVYKDASHQQLVVVTSPEEQRRKGAAHRVFGVHDGIKKTEAGDKLVLNAFDGDEESLFCQWRRMPNGQRRFVDCRWHLSATAIPYMTREKHAERMTQTGASIDHGNWPAEYEQDVWGRRGKAAEAFFPTTIRRLAQRKVEGWTHLRPSYAQFVREAVVDTNANIISCGFDFLAGLPVERPSTRYALGIDIATLGDTAINLFAETAPPQWTWCAAITLPGWDDTTAQCFLIDHLVYQYHVDFIGYDRSTVGHSIGDPMMSLPQFAAMDYRDPARFFGINSTEKYLWDERVDANKLARARTDAEREQILANPDPVECVLLQWYMPTLRQWMQEPRIIFPAAEQAPEIDALLGSISRRFKAGQRGTVAEYKPGHPDLLSGLGCFMGALQQIELLTRRGAPQPTNRQKAKDLRRLMRTKITSPLHR